MRWRSRQDPLFILFLSLLLAGCARVSIKPDGPELKPIRTAPAVAATAAPATGTTAAVVVPPPPVPEPTGPVIPALKDYPLGEKLDYQISWLGVPVGLVTLSVSKEQTDPELKGSVQLMCVGRSNRYLDAFYPVVIQLVSFVNPRERMPRRFEASLKQRKKGHESSITFDPKTMTALHKMPKNRNYTVPITKKTQDGLSILFHSRMTPFRTGQVVPLEIAADGKNWDLTGQILGIDTVKLRGVGTFKAFQADITLTYPVPFFEGSEARLWFSADERRIPLVGKIKSSLGPVTIVLLRRELLHLE
jgi:hypothetical protein